jgi:DNA-directed RNA polymerase subunit RPC12/RpoP
MIGVEFTCTQCGSENESDTPDEFDTCYKCGARNEIVRPTSVDQQEPRNTFMDQIADGKRRHALPESAPVMEYEYKVIDVADGAISSVLLGDGRIETYVLQAYINAMASEGWRMVFMAKVMQRHVVIAERETLMVTFERRVPESERAARAARCIDDVIAAEDAAKKQGHKAAAGAVGLAVGSAVLGSVINNLTNNN